MDSMNFIVGQIEDEKDSWKVKHEEAMECWDVVEDVQKGLGFYHMIRMADQSWSRKVEEGVASFDAAIARGIRANYVWWYERSDELIGLIEKMERQFGSLDGAMEFKRAAVFVRSVLSTPIDDLIDSLTEESITLGEASNGASSQD